MKPRIIFFDDGGVLNDNTVRAREWKRLVGEFLAPRLGERAAVWGEANGVVFERQWRRYEAWMRQRQQFAYADFFASRPERERWMREMCEFVGIAAPPSDQCVALAAETEEYVLPRVRAAFPEAAAVLHSLAEAGQQMSTASGGTSRELEGYLTGVGVRELFTQLYGPDLVQTIKDSPRYYQRIFQHANVHPAEALVVDDSPHMVAHAAQAGARAVLVARDGKRPPKGAPLVIHDLTELPGLLDSID